MGLAVRTAAIGEILESLEAAGIGISRVTSTDLLALWRVRNGRKFDYDYCLIDHAGRSDAFRLNGDRPTGWYSAPGEGALGQLADALAADQLLSPAESGQPTACLIGEVTPEGQTQLEERTGIHVAESVRSSPIALAAASAADDRAGWVDFRRGGLAPKNPWGRSRGLLAAVVVLALLLPAVLAGAMVWRANRYDAAAEQHTQRQHELYRKLYTNTTIPTDVRSRLTSELARLSAISGAGLAETPVAPNALECLRRVCGSLPPAMRLRISYAHVGPREILLDGQTRTHSDAEILAQAVHRAGFSVEPPRTESLVRGGVTFTIIAKPRAAVATAQPAKGVAP